MALTATKTGQARTLVATCTASFVMLFNITAPTVAFGRIQVELGARFEDLQWVVSAYSLALAVFLLTAGDLADRYGRRRLFLSGATLFIVSSMVCGLAGSPLMLNLARAGQGAGGAVLIATSLALLAAEFRGRARATAMSAWAAAIGAGVGVGPLLGGALTSAFGWRWLFFANVPLMLIALVAALRVPESRDTSARGIDLPGLVTFSGAMFLIVFGIVRGNSAGWSSPLILGSLTAGAALLAAFVLVERRQRRPMLDLDLFRNRGFLGVSLAGFGVGASIFAATVYVTLYLLGPAGASPVQAGLELLPYALAQVAGSPVARWLEVRLPARVMLGGGLTLTGAGLLLMAAMAHDSGWLWLIPGLMISGFGATLVNVSGAVAAVQVVAVARSGMASGINNTFRQMGVATGTAALGALLQHGTSFLSGLHAVLVVSGLLALVAAVAAAVLVRERDLDAAAAASNSQSGVIGS